MSPRILALRHCPHCKAELPAERPRVCPECGGSLQHRYLKAGCLTSKPLLALLVAAALAALAAARAARPAPDAGGSPAAPLHRAPAAHR